MSWTTCSTLTYSPLVSWIHLQHTNLLPTGVLNTPATHKTTPHWIGGHLLRAQHHWPSYSRIWSWRCGQCTGDTCPSPRCPGAPGAPTGGASGSECAGSWAGPETSTLHCYLGHRQCFRYRGCRQTFGGTLVRVQLISNRMFWPAEDKHHFHEFGVPTVTNNTERAHNELSSADPCVSVCYF